MTIQRRLLFAAVSILPLLVVATISQLTELESWLFILLTAVGSLATMLTMWLLTQREAAVHQAAGQIQQALELEQEDEEYLVTPLNAITPTGRQQVVASSMTKLVERLLQHRSSIQHNLRTIQAAQEELKQGPSKPLLKESLSSPVENDAAQFAGSFQELAQQVQLARQRAETYTSIYRELPAATLLVDRQYKIVSLNRMAENLFGYTTAQLQKRSITLLFGNPDQLLYETHESPARDLKDALTEIIKHKAERVTVVLKNAKGRVQAACLSAKFGSHLIFTITPRERMITHEREVRELHRRATVLQLASCLRQQVLEPVEQIQTALKVLTQLSKKAQQKELFSEQIETARNNIQKPRQYADLLQWLAYVESKSVPTGECEEIHLQELVDSISQRIAPELKLHGGQLHVEDQGTWMLADENRVEMLMLGLLHHAARSLKEGDIHLKLVRTDSNSEGHIAINLEYHTQPLESRFISDLNDPFARLETLLMDPEQRGSLLGLYVAKSLAQMMGGSLALQNLSGYECKIHVLLPARQTDRLAYELVDQQKMTVGDFHVAAGESIETASDMVLQLTELHPSLTLEEDLHVEMQEEESALVSLDGALGDWKLG